MLQLGEWSIGLGRDLNQGFFKGGRREGAFASP